MQAQALPNGGAATTSVAPVVGQRRSNEGKGRHVRKFKKNRGASIIATFVVLERFDLMALAFIGVLLANNTSNRSCSCTTIGQSLSLHERISLTGSSHLPLRPMQP